MESQSPADPPSRYDLFYHHTATLCYAKKITPHRHLRTQKVSSVGPAASLGASRLHGWRSGCEKQVLPQPARYTHLHKDTDTHTSTVRLLAKKHHRSRHNSQPSTMDSCPTHVQLGAKRCESPWTWTCFKEASLSRTTHHPLPKTAPWSGSGCL